MKDLDIVTFLIFLVIAFNSNMSLILKTSFLYSMFALLYFDISLNNNLANT